MDAETPVSALPLLLCVVLGLLFVVTTRFSSDGATKVLPLVRQVDQELELRFFDEPIVEIAQAPEKAPEPIAEPVAPPSPPAPERKISGDTPPRSEHAFDPAQLVVKPISVPLPSASRVDTVESDLRIAARPSLRNRPRRPEPVFEVAGLSSRIPQPSRDDSGSSPSPPPRGLRPGSGSNDSRPASLASWRPSESEQRRSFVSDLAAFEARDPAAAEAAAERPPVAAAMATSSSQTLEALQGELAGNGPRADWREVPLDELPACTPPGRQDLLKKRILLAAPFERECSHRDGSYRFVETRNLGAFLMWSRTTPDRPARREPIRDVCDVLERALQCLTESSSKEFKSR